MPLTPRRIHNLVGHRRRFRRWHPDAARRFRVLDNIEELIAVVLLCLIGATIALQVFMRSAFSSPMSWPEELSQFLFVWASVLGAVGAAKRSALVRLETVAEKLPPEVKRILRQMRVEAPKVKVGFQVGQNVRIVDGPFQDFTGTVDDINLEKGKVKILVNMFGRETPIELDFLQVERL